MVMDAHAPLASVSNWMPTALLLARPENLYELTFLRLLGSDVRTTLPDLRKRNRRKKKVGEKKLHPRVHYAGIGRAALELISAAETSCAEKGVGCFLIPREKGM